VRRECSNQRRRPDSLHQFERRDADPTLLRLEELCPGPIGIVFNFEVRSAELTPKNPNISAPMALHSTDMERPCQ